MRQSPDLNFEIPLWQQGLLLAGLDEAGRGAWAGPVSAGAVVLPPDPDLTQRPKGVRDSKQMTARQRTVWAKTIQSVALAWGVGMASHLEIDSIGILPATRLAMRRALEALSVPPQHLLIDAVRLADIPLPQTSLIKGDCRCLSIAAASVLAKTARDALMVEMAEQYPGYGFEKHKGYGTASHQWAMQAQGLSAIHRLSYAPCRVMMEDKKIEVA
jgi:ribonuclease HII